MAVLVILLLAPFLPYTALAAFSPPFSFFVSCGAASNVSFPYTAVLACGVFCLFFVLRRRRQMPRPAPEEKESTQLPWSPYTQDGSGWVDQSNRSGEGTTVGLQRVSTQLHISLAEIKEATDNFHERNLIGVGGFGNVYRGVLRDGTRVAVKRAMRASMQGLPEFQTEIVVLSRIRCRHRHLVSLIGCCNEQAEMILVYEYMEKGTLRSHLYGSEEPPLSWKLRLEICIGAARGLHYLHTGCSENIIHRDVKSTNILLGDGFITKVADFGLSRIGPSFGETHVSTVVKGSFGYLDPEYFKTQQLTDRSDVYSFGVVLFEVMCARPVIDQSLDRDQINLSEWAIKWLQKGQLDKITDWRIIGQVNENSLRKFAETAEKCLADYGQNRPSMGDVLWNLEFCLQLQETHVKRDAFEDSGAVATQFPADVVVPRWMQSSNSFLTDDADETGMTEMGVANSKAEPGKIGLWGANNGTLHDIEGVPGRLESVTVCSGEVINSLAFSYIDRNGLQHAAGPWGGHAGSDHTVRTARDVRLELLEKITGGFSEEHKIGSGGYGKVYKGVLNGKEIAVKKLHCHVALDDVIFKNECENLMRVRHQNIVELVGYCHEIRHRYVEHNGRTVCAEMVDSALCFEYSQNGSLDKHLYEEHRGLDWCTRYRIIKGICEGLNYLHGLEESILHLDLKPANILLDENMVPKIADFGLSRLFGGTHTHITKNPVGTVMYMPPEYVNKCIITKKYDVFSLGVIIIQIMTGREGCSKYWEMSSQQFIELVHQNWKVRVEATSMHTSAEDCKQVKRCIEIALNCVKPKRQKRPTTGDIIHKLRETKTVTHEVPMPFSQESGSASSSHIKTEMVQNWSQEKQHGGQVKDSSNQQHEVLQKQSGMQQKDSSNEQPGSLEKEYEEDTKKRAASGLRGLDARIYEVSDFTQFSHNLRGLDAGSTKSRILLNFLRNCKVWHMKDGNRKLRGHFNRNGGQLLNNSNIRIFTKENLDKITKNFSKTIGKGSFGQVYEGIIDDKQRVAVKRSIEVDAERRKDFANEITIQSKISHKNLVRLIGCCLETDVPMLVYEFIDRGSLYDMLHSGGGAGTKNYVPKEKQSLPLQVRLDISIGSAEALAYMHSSASQNILHGDVKSGNILLHENFSPKISDFGTSRLLSMDQKHTQFVVGDMGYIDPVYMQTGLLTEKSDVYSFGVVLLELITRKKARYDNNNSLPINFVKSFLTESRAREMFDQEVLCTENLDCLVKVGGIAVQCLREDVDERPTMMKVLEDLRMVRVEFARDSVFL